MGYCEVFAVTSLLNVLSLLFIVLSGILLGIGLASAAPSDFTLRHRIILMLAYYLIISVFAFLVCLR